MDYLYNSKKVDEIKVGDIIFTETNENNLPLCKFIVLKDKPNKIKYVFCLDDGELDDMDFHDQESVYYLGNIYEKLSHKELMKNVQIRYIWLGIQYETVKVLVNLLDGTVERYDQDSEEWEFLSDEVEDNGYIMTITVNDVKFRINLTNLKVQIMNNYTTRFKNYNNFILGLEGQYVFNEHNELELIKDDGGKDYGEEDE